MDLVLFDIDGTLVDTGGAGRRAIEQAARALFGRGDIFKNIAFEGATDRSICRAALRNLDRPFDDTEIDRLLDAYVSFLATEVECSARYRIFPGVERLAQRMLEAGILIGLGTGNIEAGARVKLERGGLNRFFAFGGFGDDGEDRSALVRAGLHRGERILSRKPKAAWVIGDTPRDLAAARANGANVVLVATGSFSKEELEACRPDLCVETLEDSRVMALVDPLAD